MRMCLKSLHPPAELHSPRALAGKVGSRAADVTHLLPDVAGEGLQKFKLLFRLDPFGYSSGGQIICQMYDITYDGFIPPGLCLGKREIPCPA